MLRMKLSYRCLCFLGLCAQKFDPCVWCFKGMNTFVLDLFFKDFKVVSRLQKRKVSKQASKQTSKQASKQTSKQASKQASNQATKQPNNQTTKQPSNLANQPTNNQTSSSLPSLFTAHDNWPGPTGLVEVPSVQVGKPGPAAIVTLAQPGVWLFGPLVYQKKIQTLWSLLHFFSAIRPSLLLLR